MKVRMRDVKVKFTENEYNFLSDFVNSMRKQNPKHINNITISSLVKFAVMNFYMAYLMGKIGDLKELKESFIKKYAKSP